MRLQGVIDRRQRNQLPGRCRKEDEDIQILRLHGREIKRRANSVADCVALNDAIGNKTIERFGRNSHRRLQNGITILMPRNLDQPAFLFPWSLVP